MHTSLNRDLDRTPMVLLYPLLLTVGLGSFFWLMSVGFNSFLASALPVISSLAVIRLLEIRYPYRHDWLASGREMRTDIAFLLVVQGIAPKLLALGCAILLADSEWLHFEQSPWPGHWPVAAQALLMLVSADLLRYWLHRAAHRVPLLWRFHSIHHQPRKLYSLNVTRFHPAEKALQFAVDTLPFIVLGAGSEVIAAYFVFYAINGFLQHSNLDLHCGPLNYLLSTNDLHRWHHGRDSAMAQCNYGNNLILWDLLFGTYYRPQQHVPRFIGIRGVAQCGFRQALGLPFKGLANSIRKRLHRWVIAALFKLGEVRYWWWFRRQCRRPEVAQQCLLRRILEEHSDTRFGRKHGFASIRDYHEYRDRVAVHDYEALRPWFERQARRSSNEITAETPLLYAQTSGSTGQPKYIPVTPRSLREMKRSQAMSSLMMYRTCPEAFHGKMLGIVSPAREGYNEWGFACGSASGLVVENMPSITRRNHLLPRSVYAIDDYEIKYDLILLHALAEPDISFIGTANPSTVLALLKRLNTRKEYYLELLRRPQSERCAAEFDMQQNALLGAIYCSQKRRQVLERLFARTRHLQIADLWPGLKLVVTWTGGSCGVPLDALTRQLPEGCQLMELGYIASEFRGTISHGRNGYCIPTLHENFFEFVERERFESGRPEYLRLHEIEEGRDYYVFVTNRNGLYRYHINDIVQVRGRFENTPCLQFLQKGKGITNITGEKLAEDQLGSALRDLSAELDIVPEFHVCLADETAGQYRLFVETDHCPGNAATRIAACVESALCTQNIEYREKRRSGRLLPLAVELLESGTAERYKKSLLDQGQRESQFKVMTLQYARDNHFPFQSFTVDRAGRNHHENR